MTEIKFWKDDKKEKIEPSLFFEQAKKLAKKLAEDKRTDKRTQIRKFYDEVLRLDMEAKTQEWDNVLPFVHMLMAKVAYAKGRKLVSDEFANTIESCIRQILRKEDLFVFANFFEAFMGFYKMYRPSDN